MKSDELMRVVGCVMTSDFGGFFWRRGWMAMRGRRI
jgi:hypothetical protein